MTRLLASSFWLLIAALAAIVGAAFVLGGTDSWHDRALLIAAQIDPLVAPARIVTRFGDWWAVLLIGAVAAAMLAFRGRRRAALLLAVLLVSERLVVAALKLGFSRDRPDPAGHLDAVHTMAFPSGHSANAMTLGLGLALLCTASGRGRGPALAAGLLFAFLVGTSRMVLGVHWPSDVAGGWAFGALWTLLLLRLAAERRPGPGIDSPEQGERYMTDRNDRGADRAETARLNDDKDITEAAEGGPAFGGSHGGNLQRDIGARDEVHEEVGDGSGVTRVRDSDKPEQANLPRFNDS